VQWRGSKNNNVRVPSSRGQRKYATTTQIREREAFEGDFIGERIAAQLANMKAQAR